MNDIISVYIVILFILLIVIGIFTFIGAYETRKEKENIAALENAFDESGIPTKLCEQFQVLFGSRQLHRVYNCSRQLASNFDYQENQLNYLHKYFGFVINDETLGHLYSVYILLKKLDQLIESNSEWSKYSNIVQPAFSMYYVSPAQRSSYRSTYEFNTVTIKELTTQVKQIQSRQSSRKVQRSKMTPELRDAILRRDNWTCQICGNSVFKERNLLLEVDHIIPIAKGGKTEPNNLQTLCWRCNRKKSDGLSTTFTENNSDTEKLVFPDDSFLEDNKHE